MQTNEQVINEEITAFVEDESMEWETVAPGMKRNTGKIWSLEQTGILDPLTWNLLQMVPFISSIGIIFLSDTCSTMQEIP